jgi:hypothetical protein
MSIETSPTAAGGRRMPEMRDELQIQLKVWR